MSIILHPRTIQTQESAQITTWTADVPSIKTISLENGHMSIIKHAVGVMT